MPDMFHRHRQVANTFYIGKSQHAKHCFNDKNKSCETRFSQTLTTRKLSTSALQLGIDAQSKLWFTLQMLLEN